MSPKKLDEIIKAHEEERRAARDPNNVSREGADGLDVVAFMEDLARRSGRTEEEVAEEKLTRAIGQWLLAVDLWTRDSLSGCRDKEHVCPHCSEGLAWGVIFKPWMSALIGDFALISQESGDDSRACYEKLVNYWNRSVATLQAEEG